MSFLVRPKIAAERIPGITLMAAVVVCNAIERVCDVKCAIKWPNDILINSKKVCGILTESVFGASGIERVVCGIGINTNQKFDETLVDKAASLDIRTNEKRRTLCDHVVNGFFDAYDRYVEFGLSAFMDEFKQRSVLRGVVTIVTQNEQIAGKFVDFDDTGAILIDIGGEVKHFIAGEISLRGEDGYV